ncbi:MAG: DNA repair protein RecO [Parachlamydiaceae bacterium]|nr:DNA repair protein RecO [Parachlamydiaceae bacterium]
MEFNIRKAYNSVNMSYSFQKTEGIILHQIPFQNYDNILTLFTQDAGIIKILDKGGRSKRKGSLGISLPLTKVEVVYIEKKSEIFSCKEIYLLDSYHFLRNELAHIAVGCDLLKTIQVSQFLNKPATSLYQLLSTYINHIPTISNPWILSASFKLKLLRHDGLSPFPLICSQCQSSIFDAAFNIDSNWICCLPLLLQGTTWSQEEIVLLYQLALCQNFKELSSYSITPEFQQKVTIFFDNCLRS